MAARGSKNGKAPKSQSKEAKRARREAVLAKAAKLDKQPLSTWARNVLLLEATKFTR